MSELGAALRQFSERVERGEELAGAVQCFVVLADASGKIQTTYMGKLRPTKAAGLVLLAAGVQKLALSTEETAR